MTAWQVMLAWFGWVAVCLYVLYRLGGIASTWHTIRPGFRALGGALLNGRHRQVPPSLFPTWDEYLDRLAGDVDGTDMAALVAAAGDRAAGAEPPPWEPPVASLLPPDYDDGPVRSVPRGPGAASQPLVLRVDGAQMEKIEDACRYAFTRYGSSRPIVLPSNVEYTPLPRSRYADCTHPDAETESVHMHHSLTPVRTFVIACRKCDDTLFEDNRRAILREQYHPVGIRACGHAVAPVMTPVTDPHTGEHLGDVDCCPACYEDVNGEPPPHGPLRFHPPEFD